METGEKCIIADSIQQTILEKVIHPLTYKKIKVLNYICEMYSLNTKLLVFLGEIHFAGVLRNV